MGTEFPWRWGRGTISANLDVIWGMSAKAGRRQNISEGLVQIRRRAEQFNGCCLLNAAGLANHEQKHAESQNLPLSVRSRHSIHDRERGGGNCPQT